MQFYMPYTATHDLANFFACPDALQMRNFNRYKRQFSTICKVVLLLTNFRIFNHDVWLFGRLATCVT